MSVYQQLPALRAASPPVADSSETVPIGQAHEPLFVERPDGLKHLPERRTLAFIGLVRAGSLLARRLDMNLQQAHQLSLPVFEVLLHLAVLSPDGSLRLNQLVAQAPLSQSRMSRLTAELEGRGLVRRIAADDDGRGVVVSITDAGLACFKAAQETHLHDLDRQLFSRLSWEDVRRLADITLRLLDDDGPLVAGSSRSSPDRQGDAGHRVCLGLKPQ